MKVLDEILLTAGIESLESQLLKSGYNFDTYNIKSNQGEYIAHTPNSKADSGASLDNIYIALTLLADQGFDFAPAIIAYDQEKQILIESKVGQEDGLLKDFSKQQLETFVTHLAKVHAITTTIAKPVLEKQGITVPTPISSSESINIFGRDRFELVRASLSETAVCEWIAPRLERAAEKLIAIHTHQEARLQHGDIGSNFRVDGEKLFIIDWEFSRFGFDHELAYIKIHSHPTAEQFEQLVTLYAAETGMTVSGLMEEIKIQESFTRVCDVIWAAMRWGEAIENSSDAIDTYSQLTIKRMDLYKKHCEK